MGSILTLALILSVFFAASLQLDYFVTKDKRRMLEAALREPGKRDSDMKDCVAFGDSAVIKSILNNAKPHDTIHKIENLKALDDFIHKCDQLQSTAKDSPLRRRRSLFQGIFPGTKWCGRYNISGNYDDLGSLVETDTCCREHDHCPKCLDAGETNFGLTNDATYSRCACECDHGFYQCLKKSTESQATIVGGLFFNILGTECFKTVPVRKCVEKGWWGSCRRWEEDETKTVVKFVDNDWF